MFSRVTPDPISTGIFTARLTSEEKKTKLGLSSIFETLSSNLQSFSRTKKVSRNSWSGYFLLLLWNETTSLEKPPLALNSCQEKLIFISFCILLYETLQNIPGRISEGGFSAMEDMKSRSWHHTCSPLYSQGTRFKQDEVQLAGREFTTFCYIPSQIHLYSTSLVRRRARCRKFLLSWTRLFYLLWPLPSCLEALLLFVALEVLHIQGKELSFTTALQ